MAFKYLGFSTTSQADPRGSYTAYSVKFQNDAGNIGSMIIGSDKYGAAGDYFANAAKMFEADAKFLADWEAFINPAPQQAAPTPPLTATPTAIPVDTRTGNIANEGIFYGPSTTPTTPTQTSSPSAQISQPNVGSLSGGTNAQVQSLGWASFASQVQGTRLFNEVQGQIQNLLGSTGQGTAGEIVNNLMQNLQSGKLTAGVGQQVSERYDMQKITNGRKKIGYEQTKAFENGSQAATLGKPTLFGL